MTSWSAFDGAGWTRFGAVAVLAALGLFGKQLPGVALISLVAVVVSAVALSDRLLMGHIGTAVAERSVR